MNKSNVIDALFNAILFALLGIVLVAIIGGYIYCQVTNGPISVNLFVNLVIIGGIIGYVFGVIFEWKTLKDIDE